MWKNLTLAQIAEPKGWELEKIYEHFPRLAERRKQEGVTLSGGEQQMLAVARALARDLKLLLLDKPYKGLAPVIVEQNAIAALELANRALILDMGQIVYDGSARDVLEDAELRNTYLASSIAQDDFPPSRLKVPAIEPVKALEIDRYSAASSLLLPHAGNTYNSSRTTSSGRLTRRTRARP